MKIYCHSNRAGIALIVVMIVILTLTILAGGFALSMKVETRLARNANSETELLWLGRSGVEYAKYILAQQMLMANVPYDSLNQKWAGGPGGLDETNSVLEELSLKDYKLGSGSFSITITDLERKFNINVANDEILQQALTVMGVDAGDVPSITDSILDWIDTDDDPHLNGTESDYYQSLDPPYFAKNGPLDDLLELLNIRGVTDQIYWGADYAAHSPAWFQPLNKFGHAEYVPTNTVGLVNLFTPISSGRVNINTASSSVFQLLGVDESLAQEIITLRSGPDGADGTEDDVPFRNVGELGNAGISNEGVQRLGRFCVVRSATFEVVIDAQVGNSKREFHAILGRSSPTDIQILSFYWK